MVPWGGCSSPLPVSQIPARVPVPYPSPLSVSLSHAHVPVHCHSPLPVSLSPHLPPALDDGQGHAALGPFPARGRWLLAAPQDHDLQGAGQAWPEGSGAFSAPAQIIPKPSRDSLDQDKPPGDPKGLGDSSAHPKVTASGTPSVPKPTHPLSWSPQDPAPPSPGSLGLCSPNLGAVLGSRDGLNEPEDGLGQRACLRDRPDESRELLGGAVA